jgi:hypothetical protein
MMPITSRPSPRHLQGEEGADAGGRQGREDGQGVDRVLVEHAQDDVDRQQRREDQDRRARERALEGLGVALEFGL